MVVRLLRTFEAPILMVVPFVLLACAFFDSKNSALLTFLVVLVALLVFFAEFEFSKPSLRQILPAVVLGSLAAAGRILFSPIPYVKPVSAVCVLAGVIFGKRIGFLVGALAALASNFFFGQGPWTPWQMYAWGMVGYGAGVLYEKGVFAHQILLYSYAVLSGVLYGFLLNTWHIVGFVQPFTWESALLVYAASFPFDVAHGVSTLAFLLVIYVPWKKKLERVKEKYELL